MIIQPNTNIRIIKSPIELDNLNQLTFANASAQETYFKSLPHLDMEDSSYQRKDGYMRFEGSFDEAIQYNYCMYQNEGYSNKWFYAFITDVEYLNDEVCGLKLETDVFQTWQFDITYKPSFIEREHIASADDTIGANTQPENLETGDFVIAGETVYFYNDPRDYRICVAVSDAPYDDLSLPAVSRVYEGIPSGLNYLVPLSGYYLQELINMYDRHDRHDAIVSVFMIPPFFDLDSTVYSWTKNGITAQFKAIEDTGFSSEVGRIYGTLPTKLGYNYIPKNKKLFTAPYSFMTLSNSAGSCKQYKYEDFLDLQNSGIEIEFIVEGSVTPGCSIKAIPQTYKNHAEYYDEGVVAGKLPICSWTNDTYTNWLTQNALNVGISTAGNILQIAGGAVLSGSGAGALAGASQITSGIFGIASTLSQFYEHSLVPDQVNGNTNSGDVNFSCLTCGMFTLNYLSIKDENARVIDDFFSMYGYKTNLVKLPNLNNRTNWNYVKTINCNLIGDIPQKDLQKIKDMYNNGITLWHNPSTFLDYSQTNS